jgi:K+-transporting ATPase ATPase C chain
MKEALRPALVAIVAFTVLLGILYPLAMTGIAAVAFPHQATGSLIRDHEGRIAGSNLVGQPFDHPAYFWSRLTARPNYDASDSVGTNQGASSYYDKGRLGPNATLVKNARERIDALRAADPGNTAPVPIDLVTASSSGLDPHITPAAAFYQVGRVARLRGVPESQVRELVEQTIEDRALFLLGEPRVNVLKLNRALDAKVGAPKP